MPFNVLNRDTALNRASCISKVFNIPLETLRNPGKLYQLNLDRAKDGTLRNYFIVVKAFGFFFTINYNPFWPMMPDRVSVFVYRDNPLLGGRVKLICGTFNSLRYIAEYERMFEYIDGVSLILEGPEYPDMNDYPTTYSVIICENYLLFPEDEMDGIHFEIMDRTTDEVISRKIPFTKFVEENKEVIVLDN